MAEDLEERVHGLETAQAVQAATQAGAEATQAAAQAGTMSTMTAMNAGNLATVVSGSLGLIAGMFLAIALLRK